MRFYLFSFMYYHNSTCITVSGKVCPEITNGVGLVHLLKGSPTFSLLKEQGQVSEAADDRTEVGFEQELWVFSQGGVGRGFYKNSFSGLNKSRGYSSANCDTV